MAEKGIYGDSSITHGEVRSTNGLLDGAAVQGERELLEALWALTPFHCLFPVTRLYTVMEQQVISVVEGE